MRAGSGGGGEELREQLRVLWRRKWWIVGAVVITVGVAGARVATQTPMYSSTANLLLSSGSTIDPVTGQAVVANAKQAQNEADLAASSVVAAVAIEQLGYPAAVSVTTTPTSDRLAIRADADDPDQAAEIANAFADAYISVHRNQIVDDSTASIEALQPQISSLQAQITEIDDELDGDVDQERRAALTADRERLADQQSSYTEILDRLNASSSLAAINAPQVIDRASPAADPFEPDVDRTLALALAAGLVLGIGLAYLVEYLDDTVKGRADVERIAGVPLLASVPAVRSGRRGGSVGLFTETDPQGAAAEAMRTLRTSVQFLAIDHDIHSLVVTSPSESEGKTTTVANLGMTFAENEGRVIVVSTDLRRPRLHSYFDIPQAPGITNVLLDQASLVDAVCRYEPRPGLALLASGPVPPNPAELLTSSAAAKLFESVGAAADLVIFDAPPVLPVADALVLAGRSDATLVVVSHRRTRRRELTATLEALANVNANVVGCVLTGAPSAGHYSYGQEYAATGGDDEGRSRRR